MPSKEQNPLNPKKLLLSKWTAVQPTHKRKHFLVSKVILPELPDGAIEFVELEAVFDQQIRTIPWRELKNAEIWLQGWV
ncbi:TIGR02450 family Trp-rich protein [Polynucleobacter sp. CS-Odin-A6]|uniref:TIGR02450 family Trp-rich protein n=1 Tax=Polynucleobacter sp. CS-Odin-A6 TaxID=2689106 RepID=UPI001C0DF902|nr:TIGR02450 family Trp-rich protein [Polynucleobacter sp. CS-Odin-A6]MBU3620806.1 TIGR02450 family Trp-rich protein [Polynucleobacter sp. CS-Odin-A6]